MPKKNSLRLMPAKQFVFSVVFHVSYVVAFLASPVSAQVFNSGPSAPSQFTNVINLPEDSLPEFDNRVGDNGVITQLNVGDGGSVSDNFGVSFGSEVNVIGGSIGSNFTAFVGSEVNIIDGSVGDFLTDIGESEINISGGMVGDNFSAGGDSTINISGGTLGDFAFAFAGSIVNISGGSVGTFFSSSSSSEINISGGTIGDAFGASGVVNLSGGTLGESIFLSSSELNLFGTEFILNGESLDNLALNEAFTISDTNSTLSAILADGSSFDFAPNSPVLIFSNATVTLTLVSAVPEPSSLVLLTLGCSGLLTRRRR